MALTNYTVVVNGLSKTISSGNNAVEAVKNVSLKIAKSSIHGFLGPNGAGKTTTMRMLTTLMKPTNGNGTICGYDLKNNPSEIRKKIGYVSQVGGCERFETGRDNLLFQAKIYGLKHNDAIARIDELIDKFELNSFCDRKVESYSGGQRRRVDIALGLIHNPQVLFLDEPTLGLDIHSRSFLWDEIKACKLSGMTILFSTHNLEEADSICDNLTIIDKGVVVAEGTPSELKKQIANESIIIDFENSQVDLAYDLLRKLSFVKGIHKTDNTVRIEVPSGLNDLPNIIELCKSKSLNICSLRISQVTLDEVFLKITGRSLRDK